MKLISFNLEFIRPILKGNFERKELTRDITKKNIKGITNGLII